MPLTRRQIFRRRRIAVLGALGLIFGSGFYLPFTLLAPLDATSATVLAYESPDVTETVLDLPDFPAIAIGADGFPGLLASAGTEKPLPMASITKVITSLVVLDKHPLEPGETGSDITFGPADVDFYHAFLARNGTVRSVYSGLVLTEREVHTISLLASANNYAASLAVWAFGSEAAFVTAANDWLAAHGLDSTTVTDPTGIEPTNTSTVADLVELGKLAASHPIVSAIVSSTSVQVPDIGLVENRNNLLGFTGVDGIKTGTLSATGACLLFSTDVVVGDESITVVGAVLSAPDHPSIEAAVRALLPDVVEGFHELDLVEAGDVFASFETPWGDTSNAVASSGHSVVAWSDAPVSVVLQVDEVRSAVAGTDVGTATFTVGDERVTVTLELDATIDDPGPWWRLSHPAELL